MTPVTRTILEAGIPTLAVVIGIIVDARAFKRLREQIQNLIDDLEQATRSDRRRMRERLR